MAKNSDKQDKKRGSFRRNDGRSAFAGFQWGSVDDVAPADDLIEPVSSKSKTTRSSRRRDKDVGTMFVTPSVSALNKKVVERHAEDYAQYCAEVEDGEEDPYAIPSYGSMKFSRELEEIAEEMVAVTESRRRKSGSKKNASEGRKENEAERVSKRKKSTNEERDTSTRSSEESSELEKPEVLSKPRVKREKKQAVVAVAQAEEQTVVKEKTRKRTFLSKIKEAISTGRISSSEESVASTVEQPPASESKARLSRGKMRRLIANTKKTLASRGVDLAGIDVSDERDQALVVADLLEATLKALSAEKKSSKSDAKDSNVDEERRPITAERIFDAAESFEKTERDEVEEPSKADKKSRKSRAVESRQEESAPKAEKKNARLSSKKDARDELQEETQPRSRRSSSRERVAELDEQYEVDPIAYWENLPDDEPEEPSSASKSAERNADDFDDWEEVASKKKSGRDVEKTIAVAQEGRASVESDAESRSKRVSSEKAEKGTRVKRGRRSDAETRELTDANISDVKSLERFGELELTSTTLKALAQMGYSSPTPIQAGTIPSIQRGVDVMGQAKTGTGKTAAFMIPIVEAVAECESAPGPLALAIAPTRELAVQIKEEAEKIARFRKLRIVACYGGKPISSQADKVRKGVDILVGTPGRIIDLVNRGVLSLAHARWVVLDEADRMLDIGFRPDVERILRRTPNTRQTLLFSATLAPPVVRLAQKYMKEPEQFDFSQKDVSADTIEQFYLTVDQDRKFDALVRLLKEQQPRQAIVFCRTKRHVDAVGRRLSGEFSCVEAIHGDLQQTKRDRIMRDFRAEKTKILVATDVVGRGIDVSSVSHIFNYDVPQDCDDYVHRVGRAGRMGRDGVAYTLVTAEEGAELTRIEIRINRLLQRAELPGFEACAKPSETPTEPPVRKPVFGQTRRRFRNAL